MESSEKFVVRHYRRGAFDQRRAWMAMGIRVQWWKSPLRVAAAIAAIAALTATATLVYRSVAAPEPAVVQTDTCAVKPSLDVLLATPHPITFTDARLCEVVREIERVYGVKIAGVSENNAEYRLTLKYEGRVTELVEQINEVLGTSLTVEK